ncbi:MAG: riboflavin biosynthesis protein RibF [Bacteroidales bacterium]|nr:riboflavin biosynthesis protein RibF [Bacteroidales bacterium]
MKLPFTIYSPSGKIEKIVEPTAVTIGVFDGVHLGHCQMMARLKDIASEGMASLVVTLASHPAFILGRRSGEYWLDEPAEHLQLLFETGVDYVAVLPFTPEIAQETACQMASMLHKTFNMRALLLGYDSRFGNRSHDDFSQLPQLAEQLNFTIHHNTPLLIDNQPISSSRIRESLQRGDMEETTRLMGRPYTLYGTVMHGRGVGHTIGFPTANIDLSHSRKTLPRPGVYIVDLNGIPGVANLGAAPTFGVNINTLEVHLPHFEGNLYDQDATVQFHRWLRETQNFQSSDALQEQIQEDVKSLLGSPLCCNKNAME